MVTSCGALLPGSAHLNNTSLIGICPHRDPVSLRFLYCPLGYVMRAAEGVDWCVWVVRYVAAPMQGDDAADVAATSGVAAAGISGGAVATVVLRASTTNLLDDVERAVDDGVNAYKVPICLPATT